MREISFPVEMIEGVPVVTAPEEIDIANAAGLRAALLEAAGGVPVVAAPAEIDATSAGSLRSALHDAAARGHGTFVVDMSRTRFCDSAGLNALVDGDWRARVEGGEVRLVIVAEAVARIVALTGVDRVIPVFGSLEEALT